MNHEFDIEKDVCPSFEIAAYLDGELDAPRELELESHFASCSICSNELNQQKHFLNQLNSRLSNESEIELPKDFARQIVANAESSVAGLRRPGEQLNAVFIVATLLVFVIFAMGAEAEGFFSGIAGVLEKGAAVVAFLGRMVYAILVAVIVVLRALAAPFQAGTVNAILVLGVFAGTVALLSKMVFKLRRI